MNCLPGTLNVRKSGRKRCEGAFTLIELLVVVSIIGLLIAILLPSLASARNKARGSACGSNLRQLGMAFRMYSDQENAGHTLNDGSHSVPNVFWVSVTAAYHSNDMKMYMCPAANTDNGWTDPKGTGSNCWDGNKVTSNWQYLKICDPNNVDPATGWPLDANHQVMSAASPAFVGSYGINSATYSNVKSPSPFNNYMRTLNDVEAQSTTPVFMDCIWVDTSSGKNMPWAGTPGVAGDPAPDNLRGIQDDGQAVGNATNTKTGTARVFMNRHNGAFNVVHIDGSALAIKLGDIYHETWFNESPQKALPWPMPKQ